MIVLRWSFTPPSGVSLSEHCKLLPLKLRQAYVEGDEPGCLVVSPEIAAILETQYSFRAENSPAGPIRKIGVLYGIQVWSNLDIVRDEALAVAEPDDIYPTAKLIVDNLVDENPLDYLARL